MTRSSQRRFRAICMTVLGAANGMANASAQNAPSATPAPATSPTAASSPTLAPSKPNTKPSPRVDLPPRKVYNAALESLARHDLESAERGFSEARDRAGPDRELRFRSAFDLAMTLAARAEQLEKDKPEEALTALKTAAAWLRDAVREQPQDADARANLEIVLKRAQALADAIEKKAGTLEAKLDRVLEDQRGLRDELRGLMQKVDASGAGNEPTSFQESFRSLATWQRVLISDTGALIARAGEELGHIESKPEKERSDADRLRQGELGNLVTFLDRARQRMNDGRRLLQKWQGESAHRAADGALRELVRAREQLLDPTQILRGLMQSEMQLFEETTVLEQTERSALVLDRSPAPPPPPPWLTPVFLAEQQDDARERTDELAKRFAATVEQAGIAGVGSSGGGKLHDPDATPTPAPRDRRAQRALEHIAAALPSVRDAVKAMADGQAFLGERHFDRANVSERAALDGLGRALEQLSGIKTVIELAYAEHERTVALLSPPESTPDPKKPGPPPLSTEERARAINEGIARDRDRLARLGPLLQDEVDAIEEKAKAPPSPAGQAPSPDASKADLERFHRAEQERVAAAALLERLEQAVAAPGTLHAPGATVEPLPVAREALAHLEALRRLFFTLVEHLEELLREEIRGRDATAEAAAKKAPDERQKALAPIGSDEGRRAQLARAIAAELAKQAQAPQPQIQQSGPNPQQQDPAGPASDETKSAAGSMDEAQKSLAAATPDADGALEHQKTAAEHLARAIALLKPPQQQDQQPQDQQQNQQNKGDQKKPDESSQVSREQAARRLQAVRDREAARQSDKQRRTRAPSDPVDEDW